MLCSHIQIYVHKYNYIRKHSQHTNDFNVRTNTLLYKKYTSHTLFSKGLRKGWCWLCVRGELETGTDCYILTQSSSDHSSTSFSFWLNCSTVGYWDRKPSVCKLIHRLASYPPTNSNCDWNSNCNPNWLPSVAPCYIIVCRPPASCGRTHLHRIQARPQVKMIFRYLRPAAPVSLLFCLFTQVHLLIDGSVKGQYFTLVA